MKKVVKEKRFLTWKRVLWLLLIFVFAIVAGYFVFIGFEFKR